MTFPVPIFVACKRRIFLVKPCYCENSKAQDKDGENDIQKNRLQIYDMQISKVQKKYR